VYDKTYDKVYDKVYDKASSHFPRFSFRYEWFSMNEFITFKRLF
jgi:hypothetical protein